MHTFVVALLGTASVLQFAALLQFPPVAGPIQLVVVPVHADAAVNAKFAVTISFEFNVTTHGPVPLHPAPLHPANAEFAEAVAVSVTVVPPSYDALHVGWQEIALVLSTTTPVPTPDSPTVNV